MAKNVYNIAVILAVAFISFSIGAFMFSSQPVYGLGSLAAAIISLFVAGFAHEDINENNWTAVRKHGI